MFSVTVISVISSLLATVSIQALFNIASVHLGSLFKLIGRPLEGTRPVSSQFQPSPEIHQTTTHHSKSITILRYRTPPTKL